MRKRACVGLMLMSLVVALTAGTSASAQANMSLVTEIPFDFYLKDRVLPAGQYTITAITADATVLAIRSADGSEHLAFLTASATETGKRRQPARLIFNKYDNQRFLSAVWESSSSGRELKASKRERNLRKELRVAGGNTRPSGIETVTVVARLDKN